MFEYLYRKKSLYLLNKNLHLKKDVCVCAFFYYSIISSESSKGAGIVVDVASPAMSLADEDEEVMRCEEAGAPTDGGLSFELSLMRSMLFSGEDNDVSWNLDARR